jgi:hypothetical protein
MRLLNEEGITMREFIAKRLVRYTLMSLRCGWALPEPTPLLSYLSGYHCRADVYRAMVSVWSAELANGHVLDHATTQRADGFCGLVEVMGGSLRLEC